jgi:hypothetical protein
MTLSFTSIPAQAPIPTEPPSPPPPELRAPFPFSARPNCRCPPLPFPGSGLVTPRRAFEAIHRRLEYYGTSLRGPRPCGLCAEEEYRLGEREWV